jgi:PAS domain S-box-containing protein
MVRKAMAKAGELRRNGKGSGSGEAKPREAAEEPRPPKVAASDGLAYQPHRSAHEIKHLFTSAEMPMVFLGTDGRIQRFTSGAQKLWHLMAGDVGRPFADLAIPFGITDWEELVAGAIESRKTMARDVQDDAGRWYHLRLRPDRSGNQLLGIRVLLLDVDTLKRNLEEAHQARDFLEAMAETCSKPLVILDDDLTVIRATRSYYTTFRTTRQETEGRGFFELGGRQWNVPQLQHLLQEVLPRNQRLSDFEVEADFPMLGMRKMILSGQMIRPESGGAPVIFLAIEDATERLQLEELAREKRAILEASIQAIVSTRPDGKIAMANNRATQMFGYSRNGLLGLPVERLFSRRHREAYFAGRKAYFENLSNRSAGVRLDLRGVRKDGTEFPMALYLSHVESVVGTLTLSLITDLTQGRPAEEALQLSQEHLTMVQQTTGFGFWEWDAGSERARCSPEWGPLHGLPPSDHTPTQSEWLALVYPDDRDQVTRALNEALEGAKPYQAEFRLMWPDGSVHWILSRGNVIRDGDGKPQRITGVSVDITARKRVEEEWQALSAKLAAAQEEERRRISRELHDDLVQQLAGLSIEMGTLTNDPRADPKRLKKHLRSLRDRLIQAAETARHAAHDLHPSELDDLGLAATLRAYCEDFGKREKIAVEFVSRNLPEALSREAASCLFKVMQESLRNAAKHANAGRVSVVLEGTAGGIRLHVEDTGIGFAVPSLVAAAGLGISGMKERIHLMKGRFTVHSEADRGTRITAELPLSRSR